MKKCTKCKVEYDLSFFWKDRTKKDGYSCDCIECCKKKNKSWQLRNPETHKKSSKTWKKNNPGKVKEQKKRGYTKSQKLLDDIKTTLGCQLCGEKEKACLDFRHLFDKDYEVTHKKGSGYRVLLRELRKCCIVCCNCHRKIHGGILENPTTTIDVTPYLHLTKNGID